MDAIKINIVEQKTLSSSNFRYFDVVIRISPEFKNEPEHVISKEKKNEIIAEEVKREFLKTLNQ